MKKILSLVTLNGACEGRKFKLQNIPSNNVKKQYNVRRVRNYLAFSLVSLGLDVFIYAQGGFKITVKWSKYFRHVIQQLECVINKLINVMETFYCAPIHDIKVKITQITILLIPIPNAKKLTYESLCKVSSLEENKIFIKCEECLFIHEVNWLKYEEGTSSFYFKIFFNGKREGGIKIYNNFKSVLFTNSIKNVQSTCNAAERLVELLKRE